MPNLSDIWRHPVLWGYLVAINAATFILYGLDKHRARTLGSRIPEGTLHTLALLGGSPAAFLAQRIFHHKTRKRSFQFIFVTTLLLQAMLLAYLVWGT